MAIKVGLATLGCAKNLVDSELILGFLREGGIEVCEDLGEAEVVIVNTCAFIAEAERESAGIIRRLEGLKSQGLIGRIVVAGCLTSSAGQCCLVLGELSAGLGQCGLQRPRVQSE